MATSPRRHLLPRALALAAVLVIVPVGSASGAKLTRLNALGVGTFATYGAVRSSDGTLHLIYQTTAPGSAAPDGLATQSISPAGTVASPVQALTGWGTSVPALLQLPGGTLEAIFGAVAPQNISDIWGITSGDGGATWAAPVQVGSGAQDEALAYGANVTGSLAGSTPALTLSVAGGIVAQTGLGAGAPSLSLLTASDGFASDVDSALDASTDELVASWSSAATPGGDFIQGAAPTAGAPQAVPGESKNEVVVAGRDTGPGVFAAYTTDGRHVRLFRYGGGTVAVGSAKGVTAKVLAVATGPSGRIWVMWGDEGRVELTRSNRADTRFEPIQHIDPSALTLYRLGGDGRLGPLDLLVEMIPGDKTNIAGTFYTRVLPELTATASASAVKNTKGKVVAHTLTVNVTDAGDAVAGAKVAVGGQQHTTSSTGVAKLTIASSAASSAKLTVTAPTYHALEVAVSL